MLRSSKTLEEWRPLQASLSSARHWDGQSERDVFDTLLTSGFGGLAGAPQFWTFCLLLCSFSCSACCQTETVLSFLFTREGGNTWNRLPSDLVGLDEPDKHGKEHGGRCAFRVLSKVLDGRLVRVLEETISGSNSRSSKSSVMMIRGQSEATCAVLPSAATAWSSCVLLLRNNCSTGFCSSCAESSLLVSSMPRCRACTSCRTLSSDTARTHTQSDTAELNFKPDCCGTK